jgi:allantoinase
LIHGLYARRVLVGGALRPAFVGVSDGRISMITDAPPAGSVVEDLGDLVLLPGLVDSHVHINEPGRTDWEGFATATRAAAAGGVTTVFDMPLNCIPVTTTAEALRIKLREAEPQLFVDCGFWGGVIPGNDADLPGLAAAGARGAKCFLCHSGIDDFPASDVATLRAAMPRLRDAGIPLLVHAELEAPVPEDPAEPSDYGRFLRSRPPSWEVEAIAQVVRLVRETGCPAHVVHLSAADAIPLIQAAKAEGLPLTVETCPHYLCLVAEEVPAGDTAFKCCPPIREGENRDRLWAALRDGTIDVVVTDHSPCTPHLKVPERGDFIEAWGGIASLQLGLRNIWTEASARGFTLVDLAAWMCERPAKLAGLVGRKGEIVVGADADLVAFDPDVVERVDADALFHRHKVTPYRDRVLRGKVLGTWLRGERIWDGQRHLGAPRGRALIDGAS